MFKIYLILLLSVNICYGQERHIIDDNSIFWEKSSCSVNYRCYQNIDDWVEQHTTDSTTITSIEYIENVFDQSPKTFTECRVQRLADYLRGKHNIYISNVTSTPVPMNTQEMRAAIKEQNFRTIIFTVGPIQESQDMGLIE